MKLLVAYLTTATVFLVLDLLWIGYVGSDFYRTHLGPLMAESFNAVAAVAFYLLFIAGLVFFAVLPALESGGALRALVLGGALGLVAYATYDLTNLATLKGYPVKLALVDLSWGTVVSAISAMAGAFVAGRL
jgi:uncharacterized membrane protein